ncbi:HAD family hydrolase [soil metagenome]
MTSSDDGAPTAVLFDVDGTLVDSNYLHVEAWMHALHDLGIEIDAVRLHRMIGMDGEKLLDDVLGDRVAELGERATKLNAKYYSSLADRLRPFAGARELIADLTHRGVRVVLATSAPEDELADLKKTLDVDDLLTDETSSDDVETAKPQPDVVETALKRAGSTASTSIFVGDTRWDVIAARRAGVDCIGVLTGGSSAGDLREAGAIAVYDDVAQLRDELETSPLARLWGG